MKRALALGLFAGALTPAALRAQSTSPAPMPTATPVKLSGQPSTTEQPFVARLQREIPAKFATVASAEKAGYFQYTPEDRTGAISYVNLKVWDSVDLAVPNQLWYDVKGRLLGVDYTLLEANSPKPPATLFGYAIDPARWLHRGDHMHWGFTAADGSLKLGALPVPRFREAGGDPNASVPDVPANKAALVKAGIPGLTSPDQVKFIFLHPAMWDLVVWVLPNPDGAFADANPNVIPTAR
jgi:hypothetical protein